MPRNGAISRSLAWISRTFRGPHPKELSLSGRQRLELGVGELVGDALRRQRNLSFDDRCLQQFDQSALERLVDVAVGMTEVAVTVLDSRLERGVQARRAASVEAATASAYLSYLR